MRRLAELRAQRRLAVKLPSEEDQGKSSYDEDFKAGFAAGKAAYAKDDKVSKADAEKAYKQVSKKHGTWWVDGYTAAIDIERGATSTTPAQIAKKMKLAATGMSFIDEITQFSAKIHKLKIEGLETLALKAQRALKWKNILSPDFQVDANPYQGFGTVSIKVKLMDDHPPISYNDFRDVIDRLLDDGWDVDWKGTEGSIQFEFPTR